MNLTPLRRSTAAAAALMLALALTACGGDDGDSPDEPTSSATETDSSTPAEPTDDESESDDDDAAGDFLAEDELSPALLTPEDLPAGFVEDPDDGDDEDGGGFEGSCLEEIGDITDRDEFDADGEAEVSYVLEGAAGQSSVDSQVQSYADEEEVITAISLFSEAVAGCTQATGTDEEGLEYDLEVLSDTTVSLDGVDEQARVAVQGTITTQGLELPVDIGFNVGRIANNIVLVSTIDIGEVDGAVVPQTDTLAQISVDRLAEITG